MKGECLRYAIHLLERKRVIYFSIPHRREKNEFNLQKGRFRMEVVLKPQ